MSSYVNLNLREQTLTVSVSGGTGTTDVYLHGKMHHLSVDAPSGAATYEWQILDSNSRVHVASAVAMTGDNTDMQEHSCAPGTYTFRLHNATDGTYTVVLTMDT